MKSRIDVHHRRLRRSDRQERSRWPWWARSWTQLLTIVSGVLALAWLLLRSSTRPSRLAYPCQQAALGTAVAALAAPAAALLLSLRRQLILALGSTTGKVAIGASIAPLMILWALASFEDDPNITMLSPRSDYHPDVYLVNQARGIELDRYGGVDDLVTLMGTRGFKWHRSDAITVTSGPDGMIDAYDVVVLKVNAQWPECGGTNTDVLRGVIRRIVEHPDGFLGEVIVADNSQEFYTGTWQNNLDRELSNAEDHSQSAQDVVNDFVSQGWNVSTHLWDGIRRTAADEYDTGDMNDGYIVNETPDPETGIKVSYPKFRTATGTYVSYKHGVWSPVSETYDPDKLVVINMPVLKTHAIYAVTASVKNHMGLVTNSLFTYSHNSVDEGGLGSVLAEVRLPDLTILDCIWILARPSSGPSASYSIVSRRDQLVAGTDPIALDAWATKYILIPQIIENGWSESTYYTTQNPDNPDSMFSRYLRLSMNELLAAGIDATNDYNSVDLHVWTGDYDLDGSVDQVDYQSLESCLSSSGAGTAPQTQDCLDAFDVDADGDVDLADIAAFQATFTGELP